MFDLRAISSLAPMGDLVFGIIVMLVAAVVANLVILPKLFSRDSRSATILLSVTVLGFVVAAATLAIWPRKLYLAVLIYVVAFMLVGLAVSRRSIGGPQAMTRIAGGSLCMFIALAVAYAAAFMPR